MTRNVRTYDHFCLTARTLELVGDRWSLLVIRDLQTGAKRFTDLMDRLGGITPKSLSQRLRELTDADIVDADRQPGRREVWYRLTDAGAELGPIVDALGAWGLRHAWRRPEPGEPVHIEHLLRAVVTAVEQAAEDHDPARWLFTFPDGDYTVESDGHRWSLTTSGPQDGPEVTVTADVPAFMRFIIDPSTALASHPGVEIAGDTDAVARFVRLVGAFADIWRQSAGAPDDAVTAEPA